MTDLIRSDDLLEETIRIANEGDCPSHVKAKPAMRSGIVLTIFSDEIPQAHTRIPFEELGLEHLGIDMSEIAKAEIVRVSSKDLYETRILKDRYGGENTDYNHRKRAV